VLTVVGAASLVIAGAGVVLGITSASGPGLSGMTAAQILGASLAAARQAGSGRLTMVINGGGATVEFAADMGGRGGTTTLTEGSTELEYLVTNHDVYRNGDEQYWSQKGSVALGLTRLDGRWVWTPMGTQGPGAAGASVSTTAVVDDYLALSGPISAPAPAGGPASAMSLQGALPRTAALFEMAPGARATLSVSTTAPYYPTRLSYSWPGGAASVVISFTDWGEQVDRTATPRGRRPHLSHGPSSPGAG
jgi:hypothetical protein